MQDQNVIKLFQQTLIDNWNTQALADYEGASFTYAEIASKICRLHALFEVCDVKKGDKIAIVGKNSVNWGVVYLATVTYGATIVPLLPDFPIESLQNLVNHSDSVLLFASDTISTKLDVASMPVLHAIIKVQDYCLHHCSTPELSDAISEKMKQFDIAYPNGVSQSDVVFDSVDSEAAAVISYTSGTTGVSKGVVIPHRSMYGNMIFAQTNMPLKAGDSIVSFLPSAHMYGCAFEFLFPFTIGCTITFLTRTPTPSVVLKAFSEIKPALILSVPLVIEKIYKKKIKPMLQKPVIKFLVKVPGLREIIYKKIKDSVYASFGGNFSELVIGGAAFNSEAERFFKTIKLPFTVGYGMTECGPLMAYASSSTTELGASGRAVDALEVKIDSIDQQNVIGEIICRGSHVMSGYYKDEEETKKVIDADGWLHSGDLGTIDEKGNIFIRGRKKTMLLSASGKNIFPDEIESLINSRDLVLESLVVMRNNILVAILVLDQDAVNATKSTEEEIPIILRKDLAVLNKKLPRYMQIADFEIRTEEFDKTPKRSIRRFLYE